MIGGSIFSNILGIQYTIGELMNIDAARQLKDAIIDLVEVRVKKDKDNKKKDK